MSLRARPAPHAYPSARPQAALAHTAETMQLQALFSLPYSKKIITNRPATGEEPTWRSRAHKMVHAGQHLLHLFLFPCPTRDSVCRLRVGWGEPVHCIGSGRRGGVLWYCGTWVWRGFEPREQPVRPAPVKGFILDSIVPHAPIDSISFSVIDDARIVISGV